MGSIVNNLQEVRQRIAAACIDAGRHANICTLAGAYDMSGAAGPSHDVTLLAVSKTFGADALRQAHAAGQRAFGENYVQEALAKIATLADLRPHIQWHLIGPLQSNKTRAVAEAFDWVHSVDRVKTAQRLAEQRPVGLPPLNLCLQVNVSGEASKGGVAPADLPALARAVAALPAERVCLRGLMSIPEPAQGLAAQRAPHRAVRELLLSLNAAGHRLDTLSMGMSADLEAAVAEGATLLRVGSAIFGVRGPLQAGPGMQPGGATPATDGSAGSWQSRQSRPP